MATGANRKTETATSRTRSGTGSGKPTARVKSKPEIKPTAKPAATAPTGPLDLRTATLTDKEQSVEIAKCAADVAYFTHEFLTIDDSQGDGGGGSLPFRLWPAQMEVLWDFLLHDLVLILKARQLGISWLCCSYALWLCLFQPGKVVLLFSMGEREAIEMLRRINILYDRLPEWFRDKCPQRVKNNTTESAWSNGSRAVSLPATKKAGRSLTASLVILDEAAFLQWATELYTALKPTIDAGGQLIVLSSANGLGNLFHRLWTRAKKGLNSFYCIFIPWHARPARTWKWYNAKLAEADDPTLHVQEYPGHASEAFVSSGRTRFDAKWIIRLAKRIEEFGKKPLDSTQWPVGVENIPGLTIYQLPVPGRRYILAGDPAEGKEIEGKPRGDYSAATMVEVRPDGKLREVAKIHSHIEPGPFGTYLVQLATAYNAELVVERNNHGHAVLLSISLSNNGAGYPWLICGPDGFPGWPENQVTKTLIVSALADAMRGDLLEVESEAALDEFQVFAYRKNGSTGAPAGYHDDLVITWCLLCIIARYPPGRDVSYEAYDDGVAGSGLFSGF